MTSKKKFMEKLDCFELPGGDQFDMRATHLNAIHESGRDVFGIYCAFFKFGMLQGLRYAAAYPEKVNEVLRGGDDEETGSTAPSYHL